MPTSYHITIPWVMHVFDRLAPASVLDIGCGAGRYGFLFRERMAWGPAASVGRIEAIEIHEPYIGPIQRSVYDAIHIGPADRVIDSLGRFDLVFLGDMIEHLPKADGLALLRKAMAHANKAVVVTTPARWRAQGPVFENQAERHVSCWQPGDFAEFPHRRHAYVCQQILLVVLATARQNLPARLDPEPVRLWPRLKERARRWISRGP